jgi:toxin ParE1/3/4
VAAGRYYLTAAADRDVDAILRNSARVFGSHQRRIYATLMQQALDRIAKDPACLGSKPCDDLRAGLRSLHLARVAQRQGAAAHVIYYAAEQKGQGGSLVKVIRVLHDRMDPEIHITREPA